MKQSEKQSMRWALSLVCVASLSLMACGAKKGEMPKTADGRVEDFANHLPASAEALLVSGDLMKLKDAAAKVSTTIEAISPETGAARKEVEKELGITLTDSASWAQTGINTAGGFAVAPVQGRVVIMTYVEDRLKFDTFVTERAKKAFSVTEAAKVEKLGDLEVKSMGKDDGEGISWAHDGKLVIISTSLMEKEGAFEKATPKVIESIIKQDAKASMGSTAEFKRFAKAYGESYALTAFVNAKSMLASTALKKQIDDAAADPASKQSIEWLKQYAEMAGLGLAVNGDELTVNALFGPTAEYLTKVKGLGKDVPASPFAGFANDSTMLGLRTAVNGPLAWEFYKTALPKEQVDQINKGLAEAGEGLGVNLEQELISNLSGNFGVFFYGIDIGALMGGMNNPQVAMQALSLAVVLEFKDAAKLQALVDKLLAKLPPGAITAKDVAGAKVYPIPGDAGTLFIKGGLVAFGTKPMTEEAMTNYIDGKTTGKKLAETTQPLGKTFGDAKPFNGLYLNVAKIVAVVSPLMGGSPMVEGLKKLNEASLSYDATDAGLTMDLRIVTTPPAK
jgi:hypothetical protein